MPESSQVRFATLLEKRINELLRSKFTLDDLKLDKPTLDRVKATIQDCVNGIFSRSKSRLSPDAVGWLSNQIFKHIKIKVGGEDTCLGEQVCFNDYDLKDLPLSDVELLRSLFNEVAFGTPLEEELQRRRAHEVN